MNRISELRELMKQRGIYAYIVCTDDFHGSEYVGSYFRMREYLSGFTGSAGTLVVTIEEAALWTDGRYFIQAERELRGSGITLMKSGESGVPAITDYLAEKLPDGSVVGFDGRTVSAGFAEKLWVKLSKKGISFSTDEDLGGLVWKDRPPMSKAPVFELPERFCGLSAAEKIAVIREKLRAESADCIVISALDEIAWTLNLRGGDVDYNPVFLAYMAISDHEVLLFTNREIIAEKIAENLKKIGVKILPYKDVYNSIFWLDKTVWIDSGAVNYRLKNIIKKQCETIDKKSPIVMMKAVKSEAEIEAVRVAHLLDGVAVTRFMYWLKHSVGKERITEISAAEKLEEFRRISADYLGQSFAPIMAYGEHGAIVHYSATEETNAELQPHGLLLSDTGGHYLGETAAGTTDITRTFVLGELDPFEKVTFSLVLEAYFELPGVIFPKGVRGSTLDGITRQRLWVTGDEFNHGTGHGVGFLLNVHEGPQRISWRAANDVPIVPGMITSNEPGMYREGLFGVRHESLLLCKRCEHFSESDGEFYCFEPLTLVPFDLDGIDAEHFRHRAQLNFYHQYVREKLSPLLPKEEAEWLEEITRPI